MPGKRRKNDDEQSVTSDSNRPIKNVPSLMGEGEKFFRDQLYTKAIQCYTEALELSSGNKTALVERAACYLKIGKNDLALADAEESLKENKEFTKGLYEKAEALYAMGEFELALVFYHRGKKLRGDVKEFQLGINKAQEAIDNCVGDPHSVKLEVKGDLSYFEKPDEKKKKQFKLGAFGNKAQKQQIQLKREKRASKPGTQKTVKQLLGELYADKVYLEKLLDDDHLTRINTKSGDAIWSLANNGLDFLDSRTDFWRQQKPIYARKSSYNPNAESDSSKNPLNHILKKLEAIDTLQTNGKHAESLDRSNKLLIFVNSLNNKQLSGKKEIIANINSNIGNAHLEMGNYDMALQAHQKDLDISKELDNKEGVSRSYENIGRVYARNGKYKDAVSVWEMKLPLAENDMEKAWLYHEIGRCHLEMGNYDVAKDFGRKSLECAEKINDEVWQLNATVLIAQSEVKLGDIDNLNNAISNFEKAFRMTEKQSDSTAGNAIKKALEDCRQKLKKLRIGSVHSAASKAKDHESPPPKPESPPPKPESPPPKPETPISQKAKTPDAKPQTPVREPTPPLEPETVKNSEPPVEKVATPVPAPAVETIENFEIEVKTSANPGAGTDATVSISIYGTQGQILNVPLSSSSSNQNAFESGQLDKFTIKNKLIGKISKINIGHDNRGLTSGWELEFVEIKYKNEQNSPETLKFTANCILEDKTNRIDLSPL